MSSDQCCLYVIDTQERLMAHIHKADGVIKNICLMLHLTDVLHIPVLANTQYRKGIGPLVPEIKALLDGVPCLDKTEFNGLAHPGIQEELDNLPPAVDTLLLCGVESHICMYQTAKGALAAGYQVWAVSDGISSRTPENDRLGKERMRELGVILAPAEMIIYELLQKAGTPAFKAMLPHLK